MRLAHSRWPIRWVTPIERQLPRLRRSRNGSTPPPTLVNVTGESHYSEMVRDTLPQAPAQIDGATTDSTVVRNRLLMLGSRNKQSLLPTGSKNCLLRLGFRSIDRLCRACGLPRSSFRGAWSLALDDIDRGDAGHSVRIPASPSRRQRRGDQPAASVEIAFSMSGMPPRGQPGRMVQPVDKPLELHDIIGA